MAFNVVAELVNVGSLLSSIDVVGVGVFEVMAEVGESKETSSVGASFLFGEFLIELVALLSSTRMHVGVDRGLGGQR